MLSRPSGRGREGRVLRLDAARDRQLKNHPNHVGKRMVCLSKTVSLRWIGKAERNYARHVSHIFVQSPGTHIRTSRTVRNEDLKADSARLLLVHSPNFVPMVFLSDAASLFLSHWQVSFSFAPPLAPVVSLATKPTVTSPRRSQVATFCLSASTRKEERR